MLSAYEVTLKQGCKDEAEWNRLRGQLYAEPKEVRDRRRADTVAAAKNRQAPSRGAASGRMSAGDAEAMIARLAAADARYGAA